jgi:hypothetical protein
MPRDEFDSIRAAFADARSLGGERCLGEDELGELEAGYANYLEASANTIRVSNGNHLPKRFDGIARDLALTKGSIDSPFILRKVLADAVMGPLWVGDHQGSRRNRTAIHSALANGSGYFKGNDDTKELFCDIVLDVMAFCGLLEGTIEAANATAELHSRLRRRNSSFRVHALQQLSHFTDPGRQAASETLGDYLDGRGGIYGELEGPYVMIRAACSAIENGYERTETPRMLHGWSADRLLRAGLESMGDICTLQSRLNCEAFALRAGALRGKLDETLRGAHDIRLASGTAVGPHLEAMLLMNEAIAFAKAGPADHGYLWAAHGKILNLLRLANKSNVRLLWPFDRVHIENIRNAILASIHVDCYQDAKG